MRRVWRYGLLAPTSRGDLVEQQFALAREYATKLHEMEIRRRERVRQIDVETTEGRAKVAAQRRVVDELGTRWREARGDARKQIGVEIKAARKLMHEAARDWRAELAEARNRTENQVRRDQINEQAGAERRALRADCALYWGTYQLVEDAARQAATQNLWDLDKPLDPPAPVRDPQDGSVSVQITGGGIEPAALDKSTQVRIEVLPPVGPERCYQKNRHAILSLRVGSEGRAPIWATFPMVLSRPLPAGRIKRVTVRRRPVGPECEWFCVFSMDVPDAPAHTGPACAIDLGWRPFPDGSMRVAVLRDELGHMEDLRLQAAQIEAMRYPGTHRSTRDSNMQKLKQDVIEWLRVSDVTPEIEAATKGVGQWLSPRRFYRMRDLLAGLLAPDHPLRFAVDQWAKQDDHLWRWEAYARRRALGWRRDTYRCWAKRIARAYGTIVVEKFDLTDVARKPEVGDPDESMGSRALRTLVSPHELVWALKSAAQREGSDLQQVDPAGTTTTCSTCGSQIDEPAADRVELTCRGGHAIDQDVNAAINLLARRRERQAAETKPARWSVARASRARRTERIAEAST